MSFRTVYGNDWSEKGWRMCNRDECDITRIPGLTLVDTAPLRKGAPLTILGAWLFWYDRNVEEITSSVWGWSLTNDVGNSNHLAGVAVDVNAPKYPWGKRVMPADRIAKIRAGMALFSLTGRWQDSVIYFGEDWNRADQMHYDLRFKEGDPRNDEFAAKLRAGYLGIYGSGSTPPVVTPPTLSRADGYAVRIIAEGRRRNITPRGIQIALATALVESNLKVYANARVPASMNLPHDDVGSDAYSVGIFQQQVRNTGNGWWWGDAATCMGVESSAALFYDRLARLDYNGRNSPGSYAQAVQSSAYPDRYDQRFNDAVALYNRLANTAAPSDPLEALLMADAAYPSWSIYATPGEPDVPLVNMLRAIDAKEHRDAVEDDARHGDLEAIRRIARTAAGLGTVKTPYAISRAASVLNEINTARPDLILAATGKA